MDPQGASLERTRIDLSETAEQLGLMRELGAQVEAAVADYANHCTKLHIVTAN